MSNVRCVSNVQGSIRDQLIENFEAELKVKLPFGYTERALVTACFLGDRLIGGFMLILDSPYRALTLIPDEARARTNLLNGLGQERFAEVNGLWIDPQYRGAEYATAVWKQLRKQLLTLQVDKVLAFYNASASGLDRFYSRLIGGRYLYHGQPHRLDHHSASHAEIKVGIITRRALRLAAIPYYRNKASKWLTSRLASVGA